MRHAVPNVVLAAVVFLRAAGAFAQPVAVGIPCDSTIPRSMPAPTFDPALLVGDYRLTLVVTWGRAVGRRVEAAAHLVRSGSADRGTRADGTPVAAEAGSERISPLYGWADMTLADVNAIGQHDPRSRDPVYPGLLVTIFPRPDNSNRWGQVIVDVGSGARDGVAQFDAPSTLLYAYHVDSTGMAGSWTSESLVRVSAGIFCLRRTSP